MRTQVFHSHRFCFDWLKPFFFTAFDIHNNNHAPRNRYNIIYNSMLNILVYKMDLAKIIRIVVIARAKYDEKVAKFVKCSEKVSRAQKRRFSYCIL